MNFSHTFLFAIDRTCSSDCQYDIFKLRWNYSGILWSYNSIIKSSIVLASIWSRRKRRNYVEDRKKLIDAFKKKNKLLNIFSKKKKNKLLKIYFTDDKRKVWDVYLFSVTWPTWLFYLLSYSCYKSRLSFVTNFAKETSL